MPSEAPVRRFAPVPVETSAKSTRSQGKQDSSASKPTVRKFAVEPVETTTKSSSPAKNPPPKRFAPQPVETSTKSNRITGEAQTKPKSRLLPQLVETSAKSTRIIQSGDDDPPSPKSQAAPSSDKPVRRKFSPQLIDTSKRSRKPFDPTPTYSTDDKTDVTPGVSHKLVYHNSGQTLAVPQAGYRPRNADASWFLLPSARRRDRSNSTNSARAHSFRMPDLETIESSESEPSNPPSLSSSPSMDGSPLTTSDSAVSELYKHATRIRESVDEGVARYLLEIEARRAEEKLQEQALAAFPNSDFHEPVEHYVDEDDESEEMEIDDRPATWEGHDEDDEHGFFHMRQRRSTTQGNWELKEMRDHHDQLEQERNAARTTARKKSTAQSSPWWNPAVQDFASASNERDPDMRPMRDQARPPMLGAELRFPRSASPEPARFDVTQGSHKLRSQMCYLTEQSEVEESQDGLWGKRNTPSRTRHSARSTQSQGLWGGFCIDTHESQEALSPPEGPTGLLTPRPEHIGNPFESAVPLPPSITLPITPPATDALEAIDGMLKDDQELDELMRREYPDEFITQVYNYLSLGYPTLARPFDEELSKISRIPISELRHDDEIARGTPRGYIRLGEDFEGRGDGIDQELEQGGCARWRALKLYVREWARQEKTMVKTEALGGNWGTGARRGSWAW